VAWNSSIHTGRTNSTQKILPLSSMEGSSSTETQHKSTPSPLFFLSLLPPRIIASAVKRTSQRTSSGLSYNSFNLASSEDFLLHTHSHTHTFLPLLFLFLLLLLLCMHESVVHPPCTNGFLESYLPTTPLITMLPSCCNSYPVRSPRLLSPFQPATQRHGHEGR
jgi:hypothetical protein